MTRTVSNSDDVIDSRDIIARIEELEAERDAHQDDFDEGSVDTPWAEVNADDAAELAALLALQEECEGCSDWRHGCELIRDSYFTEYARQYADDIGRGDYGDMQWPLNCIDWDEAARQLQQDYTSVTFDGEEYWIR